MTSKDDKGPRTPAKPAGEPADELEEPARRREREAGRVPAPDPEEVPELLGERSDYPVPWDREES